MSKLTVNVAPDILDWIISKTGSNLSQTMLDKLQKWLNGEKEPTFRQVEEVSKATNIPFGYFFLNSPPNEDLSLLEFRTIDSLKLRNPSRNLIDTMDNMENMQAWMRDSLVEEGSERLHFVGSQKFQDNIFDFADNMRDLLSLDFNWYTKTPNAEMSFRTIRGRCQNIGILVMMSGIVGQNTHRPLDIEEFRAFALVDEYAPLIFINSNDSINGKLFSLVHEIAHILKGNSDFFNDRIGGDYFVNKDESICNAVAAELLVPNASFVNKWNKGKEDKNDRENIIALSNYFKCGTTVIARRALDCGYINRNLYGDIADKAIEYYNQQQRIKKNKDKTGGSFYNNLASRLDNRFVKTLANSVAEGKTQYTDAYRLTNTNRKTFSNLIDKVRGRN